MNLPEQYLQDFLVRMTYHSTVIAGYDVTPESVISILLNKQSPESLNEETLTVIENHRYAIEFVIRKAVNNEKLTLSFLFELHYLLMKKIDPTNGQFKTRPNKMVGSHFKTATPDVTPILMMQCLDDVNQKITKGITTSDMVNIVTQFAISLEHIQPFQLGNGMHTRLVINFLLMKETIAPWIVTDKDVTFFRKQLHKQNTEGLAHFAEALIQEEETRINSFR